MTLLFQPQIKAVVQKHSESQEKAKVRDKKLRKEVAEMAEQLGDDLVKIVGSGHAAKILRMCADKRQNFLAVLCQMVKFQPILNRKDERADPSEVADEKEEA